MTRSLSALHEAVNAYNATKTENKDKIKGNVLHTADRILKVFIHCWQKGKVNAQDYSFETNNAALAEQTLRCDDTIANHIKRLIQAGIVTKKSEGRWFNFTITIKKDLVVFLDSDSKNDVDNSKKNVDNSVSNVNTVPGRAKTADFSNFTTRSFSAFNFLYNRKFRDISSRELLVLLELLLEQHRKLSLEKFLKKDFFGMRRAAAVQKFSINPVNRWNKFYRRLAENLVLPLQEAARLLCSRERDCGGGGGAIGQKKSLQFILEGSNSTTYAQPFTAWLLGSCTSALLLSKAKVVNSFYSTQLLTVNF